MLAKEEPEFPVALIVDSSESAIRYLDALEQTAGLRWVLTHNFDAYRLLLKKLKGQVGLVALDFEYALTDKLRYYLEIVRSDKAGEIPVILMPTEKTLERAERIKERAVDHILMRPFTADELELMMGDLLGRSERKKLALKFFIFLESRTIEGKTDNVSSSGFGGTIGDPILFSHVHVRLFAPDNNNYADFYGHVRRKTRSDRGGYQLGIEFERVLEGDIQKISRLIGVSFTGLKEAGEETRLDLAREKNE